MAGGWCTRRFARAPHQSRPSSLDGIMPASRPTPSELLQGTVKGEVQGKPAAVQEMKVRSCNEPVPCEARAASWMLGKATSSGLGGAGCGGAAELAPALALQPASFPLAPTLILHRRIVQEWLSTTGSPASVIERAEFRGERQLEALEYSSFDKRRW